MADFPVYFLLCLSLLISFRLLKFPDLSIDAAYAFGMATFAHIVKFSSVAPPYDMVLSTISCLAIGCAMGTSLGLLHKSRFLGISKLLSGLIIAFVTYALIFRLNGYATSQGLYTQTHSMNMIRKFVGEGTRGDLVVWLCLTVGVIVIAWLALKFFNSGYGLLVMTSARKPQLVEQGGRSSARLLATGLSIASMCAVLAGMVRTATDNYSDINTFGFFLFALAGVLCGERLLSLWPKLGEYMILPKYRFLSAVVGSVIISFLIAASIMVLNAVFTSYVGTDIRLVIGLVVALLAAKLFRKQDGFHLSDD